ncbi:alginate O-acetyltransferase AlgX-related protein [Planctomycetes bacterium Poly30]
MEELVETPQRTRGLTWPGAFFLALLLATALADQVAPLGPPRLVGQERAREKALAGSAHFADGSLAQLAERHLRLNSRVRRRVAPYWIAFVTRYLGSATGDVVVGREGWLFLRDRAMISAAEAERSVALMGRLCLAMDRRLSGRGTRLVWIPVPRKATAAEALLPEGFSLLEDFDPSVDRMLIDGLLGDGARVVDAGRAWGELPSGASYLPLDTHWSDVGQAALAAEVARLYPAPEEARFEGFAVTRREEPARAALLDSIGIGETYPPGALFPKGQVERVILAPEDIPQAADRPWAVLAGTSFTADFDFHAHLSLATASRLGKVAMAATPFGASLAFVLAQYAGRPLPGTIFVEFPLHEMFMVGKGLQRVQLGITQVFALLPLRTAQPLEWASPPGRAAGGGSFRYPAGRILSSGDGAVALQIEIESEAPSRWELRLDGIAFTWKAAPGRSITYLPIVEGREIGRAIELVALDPPGRLAKVHMVPVLEAPAASARPWRGPERIARDDVAQLQWISRAGPGPIEIRASGRTPEGDPVEAVWSFKDVQAPGAVLGLTRFRGGFLEGVSVTGPTGEEIDVDVRIVARGD